MEDNPNILKAYEAILKSDFEQAIHWFEQAIVEEPNNASYHYRLSISFARSNKLTKAIEHAERAYELDASVDHYRLHWNTLIARQLLHKADEQLSQSEEVLNHETIEMLKRATELDPLSVEALLILAVAYERGGRLQEALTALRDALKLDPQHKDALAMYEHVVQHDAKKNAMN